jgi:hypothetical protein
VNLIISNLNLKRRFACVHFRTVRSYAQSSLSSWFWLSFILPSQRTDRVALQLSLSNRNCSFTSLWCLLITNFTLTPGELSVYIYEYFALHLYGHSACGSHDFHRSVYTSPRLLLAKKQTTMDGWAAYINRSFIFAAFPSPSSFFYQSATVTAKVALWCFFFIRSVAKRVFCAA